MQQINEVLDQKPYDYSMGRKSESDIYFMFTAEDGTEYRIRFRSAPNIGKKVRRVFLGEKSGENYSKTLKRLKNPLKILATLTACFEHFCTLPIGMQTDGYAIFFPKVAGGNYDKLIKRIFKQSKILRSRVAVAETKLQLEERGFYVWCVRRGKKPSEVFVGDAVSGMIDDDAVTDNDGEHVVVVPPPVRPVVMPVAKRKVPTIEPVGKKYALNFAGLDEAARDIKDAIAVALENKEITPAKRLPFAKKLLAEYGFTPKLTSQILEEEALLTISSYMRVQTYSETTDLRVTLDEAGFNELRFDLTDSACIVISHQLRWVETGFAAGIERFGTVLSNFVSSIKRVAAQFGTEVELAWYDSGVAVAVNGSEIMRRPMKVKAYNNLGMDDEWERELREALAGVVGDTSDDKLPIATEFSLASYEALVRELETKFADTPWDKKVQLLKDTGFTPLKLIDVLHDALTVRRLFATTRFTGYDYSDDEVYVYVGDRKVSIPYGVAEMHCTHRSPSSFSDFFSWYHELVNEFIDTVDAFKETVVDIRSLTFKSTEVVLEVDVVGDPHKFSADFSLAGVDQFEKYLFELAANDDGDVESLDSGLVDSIKYCERFNNQGEFDQPEFKKFVKEFSDGSRFSAAEAEDKTQILLQEKTSPSVGVRAQQQISKHLPLAMRLMGGKDQLKGFTKDSPRAHYNNSSGIINVGKSLDAAVLWHEYGHAVERGSPWVHRMCKEMLISQLDICDDELPINDLNKIRRSPQNRNSGEVALNDPFFDPYIGRLYLDRNVLRYYDRIRDKEQIKQLINKLDATEVLSMGFQFFCTPAMAEVLYKRDPELFAFVVMVIRKLSK